MAHSLLTVPVPELDPVVRPRLERVAPESLPVDPDDPVAQITLLTPFADRDALTEGVLAELRWFFADVTPFGFALAEVNRFPGGAAYLAPSPAAPFRQLSHELARRFPEYPPYGGAYDEVVPHLRVPLLEGEDVDSLQQGLGPTLPITAYAQEAALFWWEPGAIELLETFPFGITAA